MNTTYSLSRSILSGTSVTTAATLISDADAKTTLAVNPGRKLLSFPCENVSSILYVLPWKAGETAPTNTQIANGGAAYTAADKVVQLRVDNTVDIYACTDSGTLAVYETEWV